MSTELIEPQESSLSPASHSMFSREGFELIQRMAMAYSKSTLVPKHYQGNVGNCIIALNMASRIGSDPLMTMQNLYIVHGNPAWSAQFLIATFNSCGRFSAIRYLWTGDKGKDSWGCVAYADELRTREVLEGSEVTVALSKSEGWFDKAGSKWKTMPQQMLMYRAAAWFVRAHAPEIAMGLHTVDEVTDSIDAGYVPDKRVESISIEQLTGDSECQSTTT